MTGQDSMRPDFKAQTVDPLLLDDLRQLVRMAIREDLDRFVDLTTAALVPKGGMGSAAIVSRVNGVAAGFSLLDAIIDEFDSSITVDVLVGDGQSFTPQTTLAILKGSIRDLLTCERTILNVLGRLCGIASWTNRFASLVAHTQARLYDTRKTTPGWRRLEKYAVRCGGGYNHRMGLYDAVLIKDNHLAANSDENGQPLDTFAAVEMARKYLETANVPNYQSVIVQIEIDSIDQLPAALKAAPNIILLDNMTLDQLRACVAMRNEIAPAVLLEASGGVNLQTIASIAETGVERISVGALTHSAVNLDLGLDWLRS